jgi:hypothetical protein
MNGYQRCHEVASVHGFTRMNSQVHALVVWKETGEAGLVPFEELRVKSPLPLLIHFEKKFKPAVSSTERS